MPKVTEAVNSRTGFKGSLTTEGEGEVRCKEMKAEGNDTWGSTCRTELKVKASADVGPPEGSWASGKVRVLFFWLWHELAPEKEELVKNLCGPQTSLFIK